MAKVGRMSRPISQIINENSTSFVHDFVFDVTSSVPWIALYEKRRATTDALHVVVCGWNLHKQLVCFHTNLTNGAELARSVEDSIAMSDDVLSYGISATKPHAPTVD